MRRGLLALHDLDPLRVGAYGLCPTFEAGLDPGWLTPAPTTWPDWAFSSVTVPDAADALANAAGGMFYGPDSARLPVQPSGFVDIDRLAHTSRFTLDFELTGPGLIHPGMASTGAVLAWWQGRVALHGAAVLRPDRASAIAFLGDRENGKSSSAAWLRGRGWEAVSDDVLVLDRDQVLAGPRIVDLRENTAQLWNLGEAVGRLGQRDRWRVYCEPVPPATPLAAIVCLEWDAEFSVTRIDAERRIQAFLEHNVLQIRPRAETAVLSLLSIPMYIFRRPKDLSRLSEMMVRLLDALDLA